MHIDRRSFLVGSSLAVGSLACPAIAQEKPKLKVGILRIANAMFVGQDLKLFEKEGIDIEIVFFRSGAELIPSLSRGQIDIAATSGGAALYNTLAGGVNSRIVADYFSLMPGTRSHGVLVRKELYGSKVKTPADLKGMTVAITSQGQYTHYMTAKTLAKGGLKESDVRLVQMPYPDMAAAIATGAIDACSSVEPFLTLTKTKGTAEVLTYDSDTAPGLQVAVFMYGDRLNTQERNLGEAFMRGYKASVDYMYAGLKDPEKHKTVAASFQKHLPLENPTLYEKTGWPLPAPDCKVKLESLQEQMDFYAGAGLVRTKPDLKQFIDDKFVAALR